MGKPADITSFEQWLRGYHKRRFRRDLIQVAAILTVLVLAVCRRCSSSPAGDQRSFRTIQVKP